MEETYDKLGKIDFDLVLVLLKWIKSSYSYS